jgi:signal transduction histidine kinase
MGDQSMKVLLIEDNPGDVRLIREMLSGARHVRYDVKHTSRLADGLALLTGQAFDIVLLDLGVPDGVGLQSFDAASRVAPDVPIIVFTGLADDVFGDLAVVQGAQDFLVKGQVDSDLLQRSIRYAIERKRSEMDLRKANAEFEGYARTVSHDLRGPLSSVNLACESLRFSAEEEADDLRDEVIDLVGLIGRNVAKCYSIIEDLLSLAAGAQEPATVSSVDVNAVVADVVEELRVETGNKDIGFSVQEDLGEILASPTHVRQIFWNLLSNAVKHNDADEPLVRIARLESEEEGLHRFVVCDNGPGIEPADLDRIFEPFFKRGGSSDTGIGLSIVEKIVKVYGGDVRAYNADGACFELSLRDYAG